MLTLIFCFVLPIVVPIYGWNETWIRSIHIQLFYRYVFGLNGTWSVNSLAHIWGTKPYDAGTTPVKMISSVSGSQCCTATEMYTEEIAHNDSTDNNTADEVQRTKKLGPFEFETEIIWSRALLLFLLHAVGIYGILTFDYFENLKTTLWIFGMHVLTVFGMSAGAHRLWSHKCYKAKLPMRILLVLLFTAAGQNSLYKWVRYHRLHHKYCDTDADPHSSNRGFFFSHIGWIMMEEHPKLVEKGKKLDLSDILSDPVVVYSEKYLLPLQLIFGLILPTAVPVCFWNETWSRAIISQVFIRYIITLNSVWTINSFAHAWGYRPFNRHIKPADNQTLSVLTFGDGYHNYHHTFPWDYRSSDIRIGTINLTTYFIEACVKLKLAYDLKFPSIDLIKTVAMNKGDGTYSLNEVPMP